MPKSNAFFAYPAKPDLSLTIRNAVEAFNASSATFDLHSWETNDISGLSLTSPIFDKIDSAAFLAADVTFINENVAFEIGYAIGTRKRSLLFVNRTMVGDRDLANDIGIFDTLGYDSYDNSTALSALLLSRSNFDPIKFDVDINLRTPVYVVEPSQKNEAHLILISRTKKARWRYRSFTPDEDVRLSADDAIRHVSQSAGVIAPLQPPSVRKSREHNIRAMFVSGIALALKIPTLIIHPADFTAPLDVRDLTKKFKHPSDIGDAVQELSLEITDFIQRPSHRARHSQSALDSLAVGDPTAENEMTSLSDYFVSTDEYQRAVRGEVNLIVGRKGSGKTAVFIQLRDQKRARKSNVVVDLKPEGYQLVKLKERVLDFLTVGAQQHLITALWHYILLLEIAYKVLEKDHDLHLKDHRLTERYNALFDGYSKRRLGEEGDFRERLSALSDQIILDFFKRFPDRSRAADNSGLLNITTDQVTEILYQRDIRDLYEPLIAYLHLKAEVWLLFDNIDKAWSVEGISDADIVILRCLINASRRIEREFSSHRIFFRSVVFVRDDVYTLLMRGSSDYGKEMRASLDWSDTDLLREVLKRRIEFSLGEENSVHRDNPVDWTSVCISHFGGEPWPEYMARMSLMRPRNLIKIFRHCLSYAVNLTHSRIEAEDIERGSRTYAQDLVIEVDRELTDVFPAARKLIYEFSEEAFEFSHDDLSTLIQCTGVTPEQAENIIRFLLYYGVLGLRRAGEDPTYVYDVNYDLEMLLVQVRKWGASTKYVLHPALWPALKTKFPAS